MAHGKHGGGKPEPAPFRDFAARLMAAQKAKGYTGGELAELVGVPQATLSHWRGGKRMPSKENLPQLAKMLGVTPAWLEYGEGGAPAADTTKPATSETGGLGGGGERSSEWWLGYWQSRQDTLHEVLGLVHGLTGQLHEMNGRALAMHQAIRTHTVPTPRADLTPEQREQVETAYGLLDALGTAERAPAADVEQPEPPAKRPSRRRAGGSGT